MDRAINRTILEKIQPTKEGFGKRKHKKSKTRLIFGKIMWNWRIETKKLPKCRFILVDKHGFLWGKTLEVAADLSLDLQMFIPRIKIKKRMNWMLFTSNKVWKILNWRKNLALFYKLWPTFFIDSNLQQISNFQLEKKN